MNWQRIETHISFHDPESSFKFRTVDAGIELSFRDWQNRLVRFHFRNASHFQFSPICPLPGWPGEGMYTIDNSPLIVELRECLALGPSESANHYILASSEDQWCEIVAESHSIATNDEDA